MSHFQGTTQGSNDRTGRVVGSKASGLRTAAQTQKGSVIVVLEHDHHHDRDLVSIGVSHGPTTALDKQLWHGPLEDLLAMTADHWEYLEG